MSCSPILSAFLQYPLFVKALQLIHCILGVSKGTVGTAKGAIGAAKGAAKGAVFFCFSCCFSLLWSKGAEVRLFEHVFSFLVFISLYPRTFSIK